jgi:hypothetical protein
MNNTLQDLYNSEINAAIWWNWDGGIEVRMGDGTYGDDRNWQTAGNVNTIAEAEEWLKQQAIRMYPDSDFARRFVVPND